ncbi:hypothetical protein KUTeg_004862 [Tegillarca granosa]|uniref:Uncharacterized protein n=1 Tax=Tegillarca granosa TaxID=220873 RepID=A0ABQ9FI41_TEGGR|nr:hypothetical protein KUTeg_004862 [Tegillarca granosa]
MEMAEKSPSPDVLSMALSSAEQERDSLQEKVDHLKILLKQYQNELQSQKIRKEGVETVSKLLQESRLENNLLQKRNKTLETVIRNLQSRLTNNGLSDSITLEEGDMFIPGTSKQVLDNLTRENARLRALVKNASVDPEEITKLHKILKEKISENESLQQSLSTNQTRVVELEKILNSSESQKDVEISHLRNTIQNMHSDSQTRDVLCHSLTEETVNLRSQLRDVAARCQEMAIKLDHESTANRITFGAKMFCCSPSLIHDQSEIVARLRDEALLHKSRAEEVTKMNKRWQEYNSQREKYVQYLENTVKELERNLQTAQATQVTPERSQVINSALEEAKRRLTATEHEKKQLEQELQERNRHLIQQSEQIDRLQAQLANNQGGHHSDTETIEALKAQIQIFSYCRERFQPKLDVNYPNRLSINNQDFYQDFNQQSPVAGYQYGEPQLAARGNSGNINRYNVADGLSPLQTDAEPMSSKSCDLSTRIHHAKELDMKNMTESSQSVPALSLTVPSLIDESDEEKEINTSHFSKSENTLKCPRCNQEFPADKHGDLLEHIEMCCD